MTFTVAWAPPESPDYVNVDLELPDDVRPGRDRLDEMAVAFAQKCLPEKQIFGYQDLTRELNELGSGLWIGWN